MRAAEAKKRAKIRTQAKTKTFETNEDDTQKDKLSRRQRRAARAKKQDLTDPISNTSNVKSEDGQWKENKSVSSRRRGRKNRPTPKR